MGLVDGIKNWQNKRAVEKQLESMKQAWIQVTNAAIKDGAKRVIPTHRKEDALGPLPSNGIVELQDVPEAHWQRLKAVGFQQLAEGCGLFLCPKPSWAMSQSQRPQSQRPFITNKRTGERRPLR